MTLALQIWLAPQLAFGIVLCAMALIGDESEAR